MLNFFNRLPQGKISRLVLSVYHSSFAQPQRAACRFNKS